MFRKFALFLFVFPAFANGQDKAPPTRKDLVAAIRKKVGLEPETYAARKKELDDTLISAKKGTINTSLDTAVKKPKVLGTNPYTFRSVKAKADFIDTTEKAIVTHENLADLVPKDLKRFVGYIGKPEIESVGHLVSGNKSVLVERVMDKETVLLLLKYPAVVMVDKYGVEKDNSAGPFFPKTVSKEELVVVTGMNTAKLVDHNPTDIDRIFYIGDNYDLHGKKVFRAVLVELTDTEKILVSGK